jgi:hypothetical protein
VYRLALLAASHQAVVRVRRVGVRRQVIPAIVRPRVVAQAALVPAALLNSFITLKESLLFIRWLPENPMSDLML